MNKTYKVCYLTADANGIAQPNTVHGFASLESAEDYAESVRSISISNVVKIYEE